MRPIERFVAAILAPTGALCALLPSSPLNMPFVYRDSGVFLYTGWRIINGEVPYRDIWDHKPPGVLYLNALGLSIAENSRWGVWFVELVMLSLAALLGYRVLRHLYGPLAALLSMFMWLYTLVFVLEGGNLTTEYAIPIQFAIILVALRIDRNKNSLWLWFTIGMLTSMAFLFKQTTIGMGLSVTAYYVHVHIKNSDFGMLARQLSFALLGATLIVLIPVVYFMAFDALGQFWSAAFVYNLAYSQAEFLARLKAVTVGIAPLSTAGLFPIGLSGYLAALLLNRYGKGVPEEWSPTLSIGLFALPIELALLSVSGRTYGHYYMSVLPILAIFAGLPIWMFLKALSRENVPQHGRVLLAIAIIASVVWGTSRHFLSTVRNLNMANRTLGTIVDLISESTEPEDYVLLWGAESSVNFLARRASPSRFVYQYPLYQAGYSSEQLVAEYLDQIIRHNPRMIIDTRNDATPLYDFPVTSERIRRATECLQIHYRRSREVGNWIFYERSPGGFDCPCELTVCSHVSSGACC